LTLAGGPEDWQRMNVNRPAGARHSAVPFIAATLTALAVLLAASLPAAARLVAVGPGHVLKVPSQAAIVAEAGDVVQIDPGTYTDCAVWRASHLTIESTGPGVVIGNRVCEERGIFVFYGNDVTVRGITFQRGRGLYHNAAGVRMFGRNLTVETSRFIDNENGILAGGPPESVVRVFDSEFRGNGSCEGACAHAVYGGAPFALLDVERCQFSDTHVAHHIKSRARTTLVIGNRIEDGANGNSSYLIELPNGGNGLIQDNVLGKGSHSDNPEVAISIGIEGVTNPSDAMIIDGNTFISDLPQQTVFVRNASKLPVRLSDNKITGKVKLVEGPAEEIAAGPKTQ
jgi:hypothetical protein